MSNVVSVSHAGRTTADEMGRAGVGSLSDFLNHVGTSKAGERLYVLERLLVHPVCVRCLVSAQLPDPSFGGVPELSWLGLLVILRAALLLLNHQQVIHFTDVEACLVREICSTSESRVESELGRVAR